MRTWYILAGGIAIGVLLYSNLFAQDRVGPPVDWSRLRIVSYASGLTGFFDPDTGNYYLYDSDMKKCFAARRLTELGKPMVELDLDVENR